MTNSAGIFIVFEGTEGAGKTTQINLLMAALDKYRINYTYTREPGGTEPGKDIRDVLLNREYSPSLEDTTQALLFAASYRENLLRKILPSIVKGDWVISDRTNITASVYQRRSPYGKVLLELNDSLKQPDIVFIMLTNYETFSQRVKNRAGNNFRDNVNNVEFTALRNGYIDYLKNNPNAIVLDCNKSPDEVHQDVMQHLTKYLGV